MENIDSTQSARARGYETAIEWLKSAGLIIKANHISMPKLPLNAYSDKQAFKIYLLDVGLLVLCKQNFKLYF